MKSAIALKYLEGTYPVTLVQALTKDHNKTFGYSVVDDSGLTFAAVAGHPDPDGLIKSQNEEKHATVYMFGAEVPKLDEDLQPWELLRDAKDNVACVGFFEGDFTGLAKADSSHIPAYHAMENIQRKLKMFFRACKGNVEELYNELKGSEEFTEEVQSIFTGQGSIVLHFSNGHILWYNEPKEKRFANKFGIFSDLCGWEPPQEKPAEPPAAEPKPAVKGNSKMAALMAASQKSEPKSAESSPKKATDTPPRVTASAGAPGSPTTYQGILETKQLRTLEEPKAENLLKQGGRFRHFKNWMFSVGNNNWPAGTSEEEMKSLWEEIHEAYKSGKDWVTMLKRIPGVIGKSDVIAAQKEYAALVEKGLHTDDPNTAHGVKVVVKSSSKDNVVKQVEVVEGDAKEFLPTLSEKSVEDLKKFKDTYWDKNGQPLLRDPAKLKAYEDKYPTFMQKGGFTDWTQMFGLPLEAYHALCKRHDNARLFMFGAITEIERLRKLLPASQQAAPSKATPADIAASLPGARKRA